MQPLRSSPITGPSSLLRAAPPLRAASVLSPSRFQPLAASPFALAIDAGPARRRTGSHVPNKSLVEVRAAYTPDAARSVSGHPPGSSRRKGHPAISTSPDSFRRFCSGSLALASLDHASPNCCPGLTATLTTTALDRSSLQRLGLCS